MKERNKFWIILTVFLGCFYLPVELLGGSGWGGDGDDNFWNKTRQTILSVAVHCNIHEGSVLGI